nr:MFS transporter [Polymorphobacter sp.]
MAGPSTVAGGNPVTLALAKAPMSRVQIAAVALSVALNALDGFDVLSITFAAPGITKAWGIGPAQLGIALSSGLVGMSIGSLALAPLGDRHGRRPLILASLVFMAVGMLLTATSTGIVTLCLWRVLTGVGIGGMVATINAVASEFANERRRDLSVAVMTIGLPLGGLIGGFAVAELVVTHGWQSIFVAGGLVTAVFIPIVWFGLPESLEFLARQGTPAARQQIDRILARMGHPPLAAGVVLTAAPVSRGSFVELFGPRFRVVTLLIVAAYFLHITTFYFFSGWLPKLLTDIGYTAPDAIRTSALMSLGGVLGGSAFGWAAPRFGLTRLVVFAMVGTAVTFVVFGHVSGLAALQGMAFLAGIFVYSGIVGLYALIARTFPAELRVTGTGLAIGIGRAGAVLGPVIGGFLIAAGTSIALSIAIVGSGALVAAGLLLALRRVQGAAVA